MLGSSQASCGAPGGSPTSLKVAPERQNGCPGLSRSVPGPLNLTQIDAKFRPGAKKTRLFRATSSKILFAAMFQRFLSVFGLFVECLNLQKYCACQQKHRFGPSQSKSSSARNAASKNKKNRGKKRSEIAENRVSGYLGTLVDGFLLLGAPRDSDLSWESFRKC